MNWLWLALGLAGSVLIFAVPFQAGRGEPAARVFFHRVLRKMVSEARRTRDARGIVVVWGFVIFTTCAALLPAAVGLERCFLAERLLSLRWLLIAQGAAGAVGIATGILGMILHGVTFGFGGSTTRTLPGVFVIPLVEAAAVAASIALAL